MNKKYKYKERKIFSYLYKIILNCLLLLLFYVKIFIYYEGHVSIKDPIKVGFYSHSLKYGGVERVMALLINLLSKEKYFIFYSITEHRKSEGEYSIPNNTIRICLSEGKKNLFDVLEKEHIDIII